jgi:hypothetical protein
MWYILAAMHSPAAIIANQKGHRNAEERRTLISIPAIKLEGNITVDVPANGISIPKAAFAANVAISKPIMENTTTYKGFL